MLQQKISGIPDKTELIVLPEMFSTGFSMNKESLAETMDGPTVAWMRKTAAGKGAIITGSFIAKERCRKSRSILTGWSGCCQTENTAFMINDIYLPTEMKTSITMPGKKRLIASVNGWKVNLQICYDLRFPGMATPVKYGTHAQSQPEYDLLVVVANWPAARSHAWRTLLQARAIENQCYVIGVNRTGSDGKGLAYGGESMIVGPLGEPIKILGAEDRKYFRIPWTVRQLEDTRLKFPFWRDADTIFHSTLNYDSRLIWQTKFLREPERLQEQVCINRKSSDHRYPSRRLTSVRL